MADLYGDIPCIERDELAPGASSEHLIDWLAAQKQQKITCIVGHEPDLSELLEVLVVEKSGQPQIRLSR